MRVLPLAMFPRSCKICSIGSRTLISIRLSRHAYSITNSSSFILSRMAMTELAGCGISFCFKTSRARSRCFRLRALLPTISRIITRRLGIRGHRGGDLTTSVEFMLDMIEKTLAEAAASQSDVGINDGINVGITNRKGIRDVPKTQKQGLR